MGLKAVDLEDELVLNSQRESCHKQKSSTPSGEPKTEKGACMCIWLLIATGGHALFDKFDSCEHHLNRWSSFLVPQKLFK